MLAELLKADLIHRLAEKENFVPSGMKLLNKGRFEHRLRLLTDSGKEVDLTIEDEVSQSSYR